MAKRSSHSKQNEGLLNYTGYSAQAMETVLQTPPIGYIIHSHNIKYCYHFKDDIIKYIPLRDSLEHLFSKPLFCCGGSFKPNDLAKIVLKVKPSTSEEDEDNWKEFKLENGIDVEELLKYCDPATFGDLKEMKTLVDSDVRLANSVDSERFKIEKAIESSGNLVRMWDWIPGIELRNRIEDALTSGRRIDVNKYKLNVYSKGGFFKPHVDSPSGEDMIGTLVICLPSYHKGGELCVNHDGLQHVFDFSTHSEDPDRIQWAAFYSNCIHEVKPVLEGSRITITYNIILRKDYYSFKNRLFANLREPDNFGLDEQFETSVPCPSLTTEALNNVHNELEKMKVTNGLPSGKIGIFLKHKYTPNGLQKNILKGEDKALYDFLVEKAWKCELKSVLTRYQTDDVRPYGFGEDGDLDEWHQVYEFSPLPAFREHASTHDTHGPYQRYGRRPTKRRQWRFGIPFIDAYRKDESATELLRNYEGEGYWIGNEVEGIGVDKIYSESAVIVQV